MFRYFSSLTGCLSIFFLCCLSYSKSIHIFPVIFYPRFERTCSEFFFNLQTNSIICGNSIDNGLVFLPVLYPIKYFACISSFLPYANSWDIIFFLHIPLTYIDYFYRILNFFSSISTSLNFKYSPIPSISYIILL